MSIKTESPHFIADDFHQSGILNEDQKKIQALFDKLTKAQANKYTTNAMTTEEAEEFIKKNEVDLKSTYSQGSNAAIPSISFLYNHTDDDKETVAKYLEWIYHFNNIAPVFRDYKGDLFRLCTETLVRTYIDASNRPEWFSCHGLELYANNLDSLQIPRGIFQVDISKHLLEIEPLDLAKEIARLAAETKVPCEHKFNNLNISIKF